jgi:glutathione S-transferase
MTKPVIHGPNFSSYVRSVCLALREKDAEYDLHEVNILTGAHQAPDHLARNPFGKVPAFSHDGVTIYETSAITRYIDRAFPGAALTPSDPKRAACCDQVISIVDSFGYGAIIGKLVWQRLVMPMLGGTADDAVVADAMDMVRTCFTEFERLLGAGPYFGGASVSLADLHLAPVVAYAMGTEEGRNIIGTLPGLSAWWSTILSRPAMKATEPVFG